MNDTHHYRSTACYHGLHIQCRETCKFCTRPCVCECHKGAENDQAREEYEQALRMRTAIS